jgi:hypothetical protein
LAEVLCSFLLGQVKVPVGDVAQQDWHAEERPHLRMVGWKADRAGIVAQVVETEWPRVLDEHSEDAAAARQFADGVGLSLLDSGEDEALQAYAARVDHAECCVACAREQGRCLDDSFEHRIEREFRADRDPRVEEGAQAIGILEPHGRSSCQTTTRRDFTAASQLPYTSIASSSHAPSSLSGNHGRRRKGKGDAYEETTARDGGRVRGSAGSSRSGRDCA